MVMEYSVYPYIVLFVLIWNQVPLKDASRCPQGRYGNGDCNFYCSVGCLNSRCDPDNGHCNCSRDWRGDKCDEFYCSRGYVNTGNCKPCPTGCLNNKCHFETNECLDGCKPSFFGTFCNLTCPTNCYNTLCTRISCQCIGCKANFYGDKCDKMCKWNCKDKVCKQDDGYCSSCHHPYKGNTCTECVDGYFGDSCTLCSTGCVNNLCQKDYGYCTDGCKNDFFGDFCNQSCPENCKQNKCDRKTGDCSDGCRTGNFLGNRCNVCVNGLYGKECDMACPVNCKHNLCDGKDGTCMLGCKHANMTGNQCDGIQTIKEELAFQINSYTGTIIAGVVSLINIVLIVVILILHCKRRRRKETVYENQKPLDCTQEERNQQENYNMEQHQTVHYETLGLDDSGSVNTNFAEAYTGLNVNTEGRY